VRGKKERGEVEQKGEEVRGNKMIKAKGRHRKGEREGNKVERV
jgi:hypothetical protein